MIEETFERARRPEQKLQRRDAILRAARELALRDGVRNVSLAGIAARASIHKSALLRYFETREQIFLELTAQAWRDWVAALRDGLDEAAGKVPAGKGPATLVADVLAGSFADRPLLCDLIAHTPLNLERNVSPEAVRSYKLTSLGAVDEAAALVRRALPDLTVAECTELISALASLAGAVWQIANPVPALAELYASDPALAQACVDLAARLRRTARILLAGLIPSRNPESLRGWCRCCGTGLWGGAGSRKSFWLNGDGALPAVPPAWCESVPGTCETEASSRRRIA